MDVFPTLLTMAGGDSSRYALDGSDISGVLMHQEKTPHDALYWEMEQQTAIRQGDYKLVLNGQLVESEPPQDPVFLSNLREDPGETRNLAAQYPALTEELTQKALTWRAGIEKTWDEKFAANYRSTT